MRPRIAYFCEVHGKPKPIAEALKRQYFCHYMHRKRQYQAFEMRRTEALWLERPILVDQIANGAVFARQKFSVIDASDTSKWNDSDWSLAAEKGLADIIFAPDTQAKKALGDDKRVENKLASVVDAFNAYLLHPETVREPRPVHPNKLLYHKYTDGIGGHVIALLNLLLTAEITGRTLVNDWGPSFFQHLDQANVNIYPKLFDRPAANEDLVREARKAAPMRMDIANQFYWQYSDRAPMSNRFMPGELLKEPYVDYNILMVPSPLIIRHREARAQVKKLALQPDLQSRADQLGEEISAHKTFGLHFRHGVGLFDKVITPADQEEKLALYKSEATRLLDQGFDKMFIVSDFGQIIERFISWFGDRVITSGCWLPNTPQDPMFMEPYLSSIENRLVLAEDNLVEIWAMAHVQHIIRDDWSQTYDLSFVLDGPLEPKHQTLIPSRRISTFDLPRYKDFARHYELMEEAYSDRLR